jgi:hypothetical protein
MESTGEVGADARLLAGLRASLRSCYNKGLAVDPSMTGTVSFRVEVSADGTPKAATKSNVGLSKDVESCMLHKLERAQFDAAPAHTIDVKIVAKKQTP